MTQPEEIRLSITASDIADLETFEGLRTQAYRNGGRTALTLLAENTQLINGQCLYDQFERVLDERNSLENTEPESRDQMVARLAIGSVFYDLVLGVDAEIHQIFRRVIIPEDENVTEMRRRMANRLPSGPKQNGTCFVHRPLTRRRHRLQAA